ncbi:MAG: polysaccharide deacetylase family protein [Betaproteobacteria bacterium]
MIRPIRCLCCLVLVCSLAFYPDWFGLSARAQNDRPEPRVAVLMYHHLSVNPTKGGTITPELFRQHLETIRRLGLPVISLNQLAAFLDGQLDLPPASVVLTFDDGYRSFYTDVFPELRAFNVPAAVFVIVRPTEYPETARPALPHLSWGELREMLASGLVTVGSHSYDQHRFVALPDGKTAPALISRTFLAGPQRGETVDEYENRVLADFGRANQLFQKNLGSVPKYFAIPYGRYDPWLVRLARVSGYQFVFTTQPGVVTRSSDPLALPRYNAGSQTVSATELELLLRNALGLPAVPNGKS